MASQSLSSVLAFGLVHGLSICSPQMFIALAGRGLAPTPDEVPGSTRSLKYALMGQPSWLRYDVVMSWTN